MNIEKFDLNEIKKLGFYVYLYSNPVTHEVFYVGKGKGNRVFSHLDDTADSAKVDYIKKLSDQDLEPQIEILIHGLENEELALKIESSVIDLIGINNLTNMQKGYKSATYGRMSVEQVKAAYNKIKVEITEPAILIRINQEFRHSMTETELYDYTRGYWVVNPGNAAKAEYAFSIYEGTIQEIYRIAGWFKAGETFNVRNHADIKETIEPENLSNRYEFVGKLASDSIRKKYRYKYVGHLFKRGNLNPVMYLNL